MKKKLMLTPDEEVMREPLALVDDCKVCGPRILHLRMRRSTSDGDCTNAANNFEENWKSAEMP